jgi:hypothetical protein
MYDAWRTRRGPEVTRHVSIDVAGFGVTLHDANSKISTLYYLTPSFDLILEKVLRGVYFRKLFLKELKCKIFMHATLHTASLTLSSALRLVGSLK